MPAIMVFPQTKNITALDLNALWRTFLHQELKQFGLEHPECKFNINCWVDDLVTDTAREIYDYLVENQCPSVLKTGGDIIGKSRAQFHRYTKNDIF